MADGVTPDGQFKRTSGDGWWSTERVPEQERGEHEFDGFLDLSVVRDSRFLALCVAIFLAQLITAWLFLRSAGSPTTGAKTDAKTGPAPKSPSSKAQERKKRR